MTVQERNVTVKTKFRQFKNIFGANGHYSGLNNISLHFILSRKKRLYIKKIQCDESSSFFAFKKL